MGALVSQKWVCTSIQRDSERFGTSLFISGFWNQFQPESAEGSRRAFFLCVCVLFFPQVPADPPDACQRKRVAYEPCRHDRTSNSERCRQHAAERKNTAIAWNYGSSLTFSFFWWIFCEVQFYGGWLGLSLEVVTRGSFILPCFFCTTQSRIDRRCLTSEGLESWSDRKQFSARLSPKFGCGGSDVSMGEWCCDVCSWCRYVHGAHVDHCAQIIESSNHRIITITIESSLSNIIIESTNITIESSHITVESSCFCWSFKKKMKGFRPAMHPDHCEK